MQDNSFISQISFKDQLLGISPKIPLYVINIDREKFDEKFLSSF